MAYKKREPRALIQVYEEDRTWLQARQRELSFRRNEFIPMCDVVHDLIKAVWVKEEGTV